MGIDEKNAKKADEEYKNVLKWARDEEKALTERLKQEGKWKGGLDGNSSDFAYITKEVIRRTKDIQKRYGITNKEK